MEVFENPNGNGPAHQAVAAAMKDDVLWLEALSADAIVLHGPTWSRVQRRRERILAEVDRLLALTEEQIDVWDVGMSLAKDTDPTLDTERLNREFEALVSRAGALAKAKDDPDYHVRALNTYLYKRLGIHFDKTDYMGEKLTNRYAYGVLKTKQGTCANLPSFYIAVGRRLGFPIYAVAAPQHWFARYVDPRLLFQNIEATGGGGYSSDESYVRDLEISPLALEKGSYLQTMSNRDLVAEMIADHAAFYYAKVLEDYPTAIAILDRALYRNPRSPEFWSLMGQIYKKWGAQEVMPGMRDIKFTRALVFIERAKRMGLGEPIEEGYWKKQLGQSGKRGPGV